MAVVEDMKRKEQLKKEEELKKISDVITLELERKINQLTAIGNELLVLVKCIAIVCVIGLLWNVYAAMRECNFTYVMLNLKHD